MYAKILGALGAASLALSLSATASHALLGVEPGDELGLATGAPLPPGVFFLDNELYGHRDGNPGRTGVNLPILVWSTPWSVYDTRIEVLGGLAFFHSDSYVPSPSLPGGTNNVLTDGGTRQFNQFTGIILAHDFGNGFGASVTGLFCPPDAQFIPHSFTDLYASVSYTGNGYNITGQVIYTGTFGSNNSLAAGAANPGIAGFASGTLPGLADAMELDLTATKKFGNWEAGFVGFAHTDIEDALDNANAIGFTGRPGNGFTRGGEVALGGLVGYDFGRFTLQGMVTRDVAARGAPQAFTGTGKETRGFVRLILPLYVAPAPPKPLSARY